jgi:nitrate reductase NapAB chaperone NapD
MIYKLHLDNVEQFNNLIAEKDIELSKAIVKTISENINTIDESIPAVEVYIEDEGEVIILSINREDFEDTLESNLQIHEYHEDFEACVEIQNLIERLKK